MSTPPPNARILRIALSILDELSPNPGSEPIDLIIELEPTATVDDLASAVSLHLGYEPDPAYGLLRYLASTAGAAEVPGAFGYLPGNAKLADCGLFDGVTLVLRDRARYPAAELPVDTVRSRRDLFLVDERGVHRGRVTRLPMGVEVTVGVAPAGERTLIVDDPHVAGHALTLLNWRGDYVLCSVVGLAGAEVFVSGLPVAPSAEEMLLPGGTISFKFENTDFVSFTLTTGADVDQRSPIGKIRFDPTARLADPTYETLSERLSRLPAQPSPPEKQPFPFEQVLVPLLIVGALWLATKNALTLLVSPIAALVPIVSYDRQRRATKRRYKEAREKWVKRLEETSATQTRLAGIEEGNLIQENPPAESWARRAYRRLAGLWGRTAERPDFLRVSLGFGQLDSRYEVKLGEDVAVDDPDFKRHMDVEGRSVDKDSVRPQLFDVPITANLRDHHIGIVGPLTLVGHLATDVLLQVVCSHGPGVVGVAALLPASDLIRDSYDWLKWLPHTTAGSALLPTRRVFAGRDSCNRFLLHMRDLHQERHKYKLDEARDSFALLIVHEAAEVDIALLDEVCTASNGLVRVLWLGSSSDTAPQLITSLVELRQDGADAQDSTGVILSGDGDLVDRRFNLNLFRTKPARSVRALAPLYDPRTSGANAGIPPVAALDAVMPVADIQYPSKPRASLAKSLMVPLGLEQSGVFRIDLVTDGPHTLIGGTTGSGKSELLQTMVSGLVSLYSPEEVSLFLIDFKGGATFAPFEKLPHVVGYVSDLDQRNVNRSLAFLRAELRRREHAFQDLGNAKEYQDYLRRAIESGRDDVLPRLIVFFDEFATLVQEFERSTMPAVIDIAQRGRSWGVHLVLATQQPTRDVVAPKVRANVNARIALRTLSPEDSATIIDRPDATRIPRALPGRAMACLEGNNVVEFQTAFAGAPHRGDEARSPITITDFVIDTANDLHGANRAELQAGARQETQMQRLLQPLQSGSSMPALGARRMPPALESTPRRFWSDNVGYAGRFAGHARGISSVAIGLVDLPHLQQQRPLAVDLSDGGICITGPNGSGRSNVLQTIAHSFVSNAVEHMPIGIVCLDAGERLSGWLSSGGAAVTTVQIARTDHVTRVIDQLWLIMRSRMSSEETDSPTIAYDARTPILLLIDGLDVLLRVLGSHIAAAWYERFVDLLTSGRRHGIYASVASRNLSDLDLALRSTMSATLDLHAHYEAESTPPEERLPGFGLGADGHLFQVFDASLLDHLSSADFTGDEQLSDFLAPEGWRESVQTNDPSLAELSLVIGTSEISRLPVRSWLADDHVLIIGGPRSGRTALLQDFAHQLFDATAKPAGYFSFSSGAPSLDESTAVRLSGKDLIDLNTRRERSESMSEGDLGLASLPDGRIVILIDDCFAIDTLENGSTVDKALSELHQYSKIQVIAVTTAQSVNKCVLTMSMKSSSATVYLRPSAMASDVDDGWRVRGTTFRHRPGLTYKRGDAIVQIEDGQYIVHLVGSPKMRASL